MSYNEFNLYKENNEYNSPVRFNKTYNLLNTYKFIKSNKIPVTKLTKNKKNHFSNNKILDKIYEKEYFYNPKKILTLHQINKNEKEKICKTFDIQKEKRVFKSLGSLHKQMLKRKLVLSNLYQFIEKSATEKYIKKKKEREKNTFITMLEENNNILSFGNDKGNLETPIISMSNAETINNIDALGNEKILKNMKFDKLQKNSMFYNFKNNLTDTDNFDKNKLLKNSIDYNSNYNFVKTVNYIEPYNDKNSSFDLTELKPVPLPCIKFNSTLDNYFKFILEGNRNDKETLAKTCIEKLRFETINNALSEHYKTVLEESEFPISLSDAMFHCYLREKKYFLEYDDLFKKYSVYLYYEIKNNREELINLKAKKEQIQNENIAMLKKIGDLKEELNIYKAFKNLCLMIKFKTKNLDDIPDEEIKKYGLKAKNVKKPFDKSKLGYEMRRSFLKVQKSILRNSLNKKRKGSQSKETVKSNISFQENVEIKQEVPIFENIEEFFQKFGEENENIFKTYELYSNSFYEKRDLEKEVDKEHEIEQSPDFKFTQNLLKKLKNELFFLKEKNKQLHLIRNDLISKKINDKNYKFQKYNIDKNSKDINKNNLINKGIGKYYLEENENTIALFNIYKKVKNILLNPEINIEKLLKVKKLYKMIKERKSIKDIKFNGKMYSKEIFHIKILEVVFTKLIRRKNEMIKDKYIRSNYFKLKSEREKNQKILNSKQNVLEAKINLMKRNKDIIEKANRITFINNKKNDPYYKRYLYNEIIKTEEQKRRDEIRRYRSESKDDKFYNIIKY